MPGSIKPTVAALVVFAAIGSARQANAVVVPLPVGTPQGGLLVPGQLDGVPAGSIFATTSFSGVVANTGRFTFSVLEIVWKETATGNLDFFFQVTNAPGGLDSIKRITITGFDSAVLTSVAFDTRSGLIAAPGDPLNGQQGGTFSPVTADRVTFATVGFDFTDPTNSIQPGTSSKFFEIATNQKNVTNGTIQAIDGGVAFGPVLVPIGGTVPEPGTALAGVLAVGICGLARRRRALATV